MFFNKTSYLCSRKQANSYQNNERAITMLISAKEFNFFKGIKQENEEIINRILVLISCKRNQNSCEKYQT